MPETSAVVNAWTWDGTREDADGLFALLVESGAQLYGPSNWERVERYGLVEPWLNVTWQGRGHGEPIVERVQRGETVIVQRGRILGTLDEPRPLVDLEALKRLHAQPAADRLADGDVTLGGQVSDARKRSEHLQLVAIPGSAEISDELERQRQQEAADRALLDSTRQPCDWDPGECPPAEDFEATLPRLSAAMGGSYPTPQQVALLEEAVASGSITVAEAQRRLDRLTSFGKVVDEPEPLGRFPQVGHAYTREEILAEAARPIEDFDDSKGPGEILDDRLAEASRREPLDTLTSHDVEDLRASSAARSTQATDDRPEEAIPEPMPMPDDFRDSMIEAMMIDRLTAVLKAHQLVMIPASHDFGDRTAQCTCGDWNTGAYVHSPEAHAQHAAQAIVEHLAEIRKVRIQEVDREAQWYLGSMNDGLFIIDTEPRPSTDDQWHDRPDGPALVLNVARLTSEQAQAIVDAHNEALARLGVRVPVVSRFPWAKVRPVKDNPQA